MIKNNELQRRNEIVEELACKGILNPRELINLEPEERETVDLFISRIASHPSNNKEGFLSLASEVLIEFFTAKKRLPDIFSVYVEVLIQEWNYEKIIQCMLNSEEPTFKLLSSLKKIHL